MNASHTSGPWFAAGLTIYGKETRSTMRNGTCCKVSQPVAVIANNSGECEHSDLPVMVPVKPNHFDRYAGMNEALANAHLIAAAPELLAALENLMETAPVDIEAETVEQYRAFVRRVCARALAKAKCDASK